MSELHFDENYRVDDFTFVLSTRSMKHHGALSNTQNVTFHRNLNSANEFSFDVYKTLNGHSESLWDKIDNLKLLWVKELNEYYQINVTHTDSIAGYKSITAASLCESELSQTNLYNIEINTEDDILRDDYVVTRFYDPDIPEGSLLHRILSKVPHYHIEYVDSSLWNLQRSFSIDGTSIYDFFVGDCSEQFDCLFQFDSVSRGIYVYDLYTVCNDCGYRGDYNDNCPNCNSTNLKYYGKDTTIYIDKENLAESVTLETDVDSIKNCFKLAAGDDNMTAAVRNCNPNGTDYIYYISEQQKEDMSQELVDKIHSYDKLYLSRIDEYTEIMNSIYDCIDQILYYTSEMMPTHKDEETNSAKEAAKLTATNMSPLGLSSVTTSTSVETVNSALRNYAKVYVNSGKFKVEVNSGRFTYIGTDSSGNHYGNWYGNFKVTSYSDENDTAISANITVRVTDFYETFLQQKIEKLIAKEDFDDGSIFDVLGIKDLNAFKKALTYYCMNRLTSFYDAIQSVIDIMIEEDQASEYADLYESIYLPYYHKLAACQSEIDIRQSTIDEYVHTQDNLELQKNEIQAELNFEDYLGKKLYKEFCAYKREDTYSNDNYISDGLNNAELFEKAQDFIELAKKELVKSSEHQKSISTSLYNLLAMKEFQPFVDNFKLGNWIRIGVDGDIYRLRLIGYEISFDDIQSINVEFSTLTKINNFTSDLKSILDSSKSMASSYGYVSKQAEKGSQAQGNISDWVEDGLNSALIKIKNNDEEEITTDKHGILCRSYDDVAESYDDEQLKITHNILAFTKDNWRTVSLGLGKHRYHYYDETAKAFKTNVDYGLSSNFLQAGYVSGSQIIGGDIYSENYSPTTGTHIDLNSGTFSFAGGNLTYDGSLLQVNGKFQISSNSIFGDRPVSDTLVQLDENSLNIKAEETRAKKQEELLSSNIQINAENITAEVSRAKGAEEVLQAQIIVNADNITQRVVKGSVSSEISQEAGKISITSDRLSISSTNFTLSEDGTINAKNGTFSGNVTSSKLNADGGKIGGCTLSTNGLYFNNNTTTGWGLWGTTDHANIAFHAGANSSGIGSAPFRVYHDGSVTATKATISGKITATDGTFDNVEIKNTCTVAGESISGTIGNGTAWNGSAITNSYIGNHSADKLTSGTVGRPLKLGQAVEITEDNGIKCLHLASSSINCGNITPNTGYYSCGTEDNKWNYVNSNYFVGTLQERSSIELKTNISEVKSSFCLESILSTEIKSYNYYTDLPERIYDNVQQIVNEKEEFVSTKMRPEKESDYLQIQEYESLIKENESHILSVPAKRYGFIAEDAPEEIVSKDRKTVDIYSCIAMAYGAIQEQQKEIDSLKESISFLLQQINNSN